MNDDAPHPSEAEEREVAFRSRQRHVSRMPSLIGGLLGLVALSLFAGGALPLLFTFLGAFVPAPTPFVALVVTAFFFVPFVSLAFTCWSIPMAWHSSVLVRLLACSLLVSTTLVAAAAVQWMVNTFSSTQYIQIIAPEMVPGVAALVLGMAVVGATQQLWFGWNLCELGVEIDELPATSIRQMLELTAGAGVAYAFFAAMFPEAAAVAPYLIAALCGIFIGAVLWLRLKTLSPQPATRRRSRFLAIALAFAGWYAWAAMIFYDTDGYWRFYDWRILLMAAISAALFLVFSGLPLIWLRRRGWVLLKRGTKRRGASARDRSEVP